MKNTIIRRILCFYMPALLMLSLCGGCNRSEPSQPQPEQKTFRLCMGGILAPLPLIAKEKGFFQSEGVSAEISILGDGKAAMSSFLKGECEACLSGEFPVVRQSFERNDIIIIATVSSSDNAVKLLARRDRGINKPVDLAGKKIGVSKGTISNFFFDQFLKKNGIPDEKLTIIDISNSEIPNALKQGEIDAFAGTDFVYLKGSQLIGDQGITFTEPGLTNHAQCLTVKKDWLAANPKLAQSVLKALVKSEKELAKYPEELASMMAKQLNIPVNDLKNIMEAQHNKISLDQVLILALEDEARWMLQVGMVKGKPLPNYLHFVDPSILKMVNPEAVRLR